MGTTVIPDQLRAAPSGTSSLHSEEGIMKLLMGGAVPNILKFSFPSLFTSSLPPLGTHSSQAEALKKTTEQEWGRALHGEVESQGLYKAVQRAAFGPRAQGSSPLFYVHITGLLLLLHCNGKRHQSCLSRKTIKKTKPKPCR